MAKPTEDDWFGPSETLEERAAERDRAFVTGAEVDRLRRLAGFTTPAMSSTWTGTVDPDNVAWMAERARKPARVAG